MKQLPKIYYKLDSATIFSETEPILSENQIGKFKLEDDVLIIEFKRQFNTIKEYRTIAAPILKSWQIEAQITNHPATNFEFRFWKMDLPASTPDLNENNEEENIYEKSFNEDIIIALKIYPPFPTSLYTDEMEAAWIRFTKAKIGIGESIQSAAYYALTVVIAFSCEKFNNAGKKLLIDQNILKKIGEFTTIKGSKNTTRKALGVSPIELTRTEKYWLDYAVRSILLQVGTINNEKTPLQLKFKELPELK